MAVAVSGDAVAAGAPGDSSNAKGVNGDGAEYVVPARGRGVRSLTPS